MPTATRWKRCVKAVRATGTKHPSRLAGRPCCPGWRSETPRPVRPGCDRALVDVPAGAVPVPPTWPRPEAIAAAIAVPVPPARPATVAVRRRSTPARPARSTAALRSSTAASPRPVRPPVPTIADDRFHRAEPRREPISSPSRTCGEHPFPLLRAAPTTHRFEPAPAESRPPGCRRATAARKAGKLLRTAARPRNGFP